MDNISSTLGNNGYIDETIILEEFNEIFKYSLSNNLDNIKDAIKKRTSHILELDNVKWEMNYSLSENVKKTMNKLNLDYSMTIVNGRKIYYIIINMRAGNNKWLLTGFEKINNEYYSFSLIESFKQFYKILNNNSE